MKNLKIKISLFFSIILVSCTSTRTALFDQYSYKKTTELKVETSNLIDKATTSYSANKVQIDKLLLDIEKLVEYEKNKPNNEITFAMWTILNDKEKNLLAGFFKRWEEKDKLSATFSQEAKKQVIEAFDLLIQYEVKKDKESANLLLNLINSQK
ncbi:hypothetical protein [Flavobacterium sp.]|uniref:hypothetical protein n=1 Tax=Flavobacterium sp. TaxID=239 RepID=UPI003750AECB